MWDDDDEFDVAAAALMSCSAVCICMHDDQLMADVMVVRARLSFGRGGQRKARKAFIMDCRGRSPQATCHAAALAVFYRPRSTSYPCTYAVRPYPAFNGRVSAGAPVGKPTSSPNHVIGPAQLKLKDAGTSRRTETGPMKTHGSALSRTRPASQKKTEQGMKK